MADEYRVTAHALDVLHKLQAEHLATALRDHFHLPIGPILRPFPTEVPYLDLHIKRLDTLYDTEDGILLHLEYQSTHTMDTLPRFHVYDAVLFSQTRKQIYTVVIYGAQVTKAPTVLRYPANTYRVRNIYLGRRNGERVYQQLQKALDAGQPLTSGQQVDLVFQPLMRQPRRSQEQVYRDAVAQAGR